MTHWRTEIYGEVWERAWAEASDFERRRYRSLDWKGQLGVLMLVASGFGLGAAVLMAAPFAADWTPPDVAGDARSLDGTDAPR